MFSESRLTVFAARSFSQVRKLYSSSTPFRPPLIPDSTRNHPPAMSSRNTSTRFAQHLDMLPNRGPPSIIPSLQRRTDRLYRPLISDLARRGMMENLIWFKQCGNMRCVGRKPSTLDEGDEFRYPFNTNESFHTTFASL